MVFMAIAVLCIIGIAVFILTRDTEPAPAVPDEAAEPADTTEDTAFGDPSFLDRPDDSGTETPPPEDGPGSTEPAAPADFTPVLTEALGWTPLAGDAWRDTLTRISQIKL
jgi:hypothetical protein